MIPAEAVEAAWEKLDSIDVYVSKDDLRAALEAAAPYIRAQALEVAAEEIIAPGASSTAAAWLIARAAELRSK